MNITSINDYIYLKKENIKYKLLKSRYPEIDKIFGNNKFSLSFLQSDSSYTYLNNLNKKYHKYCCQIEEVYQELVYNLGYLINQLKDCPSIQEIMYMYGYIYYNGYLSVDNKFNFEIPDKEFVAKRALTMFTGKGVCRNIGTLFSDVLDLFDVKSFGIITDRVTFESKSTTLIPEFLDLTKTELSNFQEEYDRIYSISDDDDYCIGNHFEILVHYKGWHLLDPTNLSAYKITKNKNDYAILKFLRFWSMYSMNICNLKDTVYLYNLLKDKYLKLYSVDRELEIQTNCFNICEKNKQKIKKFYVDNLPNIKIINESIQDL